jgi:hypothetical protein
MNVPDEVSRTGAKPMVREATTYPTVPQSIRESVQRARAKAPPPPGPDPVPIYLACVYREAMSWLEAPAMLRANIHEYYKKHFHKRVLRNYFRFLIELSADSNVSPQEISKYVAVLHYAKLSKVPPKDFEKFLKKNEGIKGCIRAAKKKDGHRKRAKNEHEAR